MPVYTTWQLQSPSYDNAGAGDRIYLPVLTDTEMLESESSVVALFGGDNRILDFGQVGTVVQVVGILTDQFAADHATEVNALNMRDKLARTRRRDYFSSTPWSLEAASGNWGTGTLPADERDAGTSRAAGRMRLIADARHDAFGTGTYPGNTSLNRVFFYGTVGRVRFGPRSGAVGRQRIPYALDFIVGTPETGT